METVWNEGRARETLCRLLAACYYQPGPEFAEEGVFESMLEAATRIHPELAVLARRLRDAAVADDPESLLLDYTRLFLGPNQILAKPYGSVWLDAEKAVMQDSTMAVLALYEEGGFEIAEDFRELPDHVAVELEFLYLLDFRVSQARQSSDSAALQAASSLRARFLDEHLGRWADAFTAAVRDGAQSGFYRALADLTRVFVAMEARSVRTA